MITLEVVHKPLPGITPEMMVWLYNNLGGESVGPARGQIGTQIQIQIRLHYRLLDPTGGFAAAPKAESVWSFTRLFGWLAS